MSGFQSPNHTQVPNDLFDAMGDMKETELKVVMALVRLTLGYHRTRVRKSLSKLEDMTGLSRQGVIDGANAAIERGIVTKTVDGGVTVWEIVVNEIDQPVKNIDQASLQNRPPSIKETKKEKTLGDVIESANKSIDKHFELLR